MDLHQVEGKPMHSIALDGTLSVWRSFEFGLVL